MLVTIHHTKRHNWHQEKAQKNLKKHGISFEEAKTVFNDPLSITITDYSHSDHEERYIVKSVKSVIYTRLKIIS
ncbi:MAG: BrnT family toxin [Dolichospermum sp.]